MAMSNKIVVVGAINIDLTVTPVQAYRLHDSNIATIDQAIGGVGTNIAFDLSYLGMNVSLMTILSDGPFYDLIRDTFLTSSIDLSEAIHKPNLPPNIYLSILDQSHDLFLGVNDMSALSQLTLEDIQAKEPFLQSFSTMVLDTNLPSELIAYLLSIPGKRRYYVDAVSAGKAPNILPFVDRIDGLKMNQLEFEVLSTLGFIPEEYPNLITIVTNHEHPITIYHNRTIHHYQPTIVPDVVSTSGAGDALFSGFIHQYEQSNDLDASIQAGMELAALVVQLKQTSLRK